ncbi:patatin-like phospholipase family protein [Myxococcus landrumensis]|uniref:Patatin-like phospholipase family protein n=1 Tax=Myxococcus landrumensis TaxID=2813577 RepID=A0ABX7NA74_9BACT|nr:patatin-like phospholipase family protein [Myxococcus landrumus]QSQ14434.1 patatin-like phospholipase family protein [Myxococcus landrumus]
MPLLPLSLLLSSLTLTTPTDDASPPAPRWRESEPFALTISGGVSLGAYEAGLSWALVRYLREIEKDAQANLSERHPRLVTVTGASAGSINALLVALAWCAKENPQGRINTVDNNDFRDTWAPVGFDTLLPSSQEGPFSFVEPRYASTDGLLTRQAFESVIKSFHRRLDWRNSNELRQQYRYPCEVPLGITVTRAVPETVEEAGLRIPRQRFSILWKLETDADGSAHIRNQFLTGEGANDALVYLTETPRERRSKSDIEPPLRNPSSVDADAVVKAIEASSAFPFAFGPVRLSYCAPSCSTSAPLVSSTVSAPACEEIAEGLRKAAPPGARVPPLQVCSQDFFDGGVFDNAPVGVALQQAEQFLTQQQVNGPNPLRPLTYLFVDPDFRRHPASPSGVKPKEVPDLSKQVDFILSAVGTARSFQLHTAIQNKGWNQTLRSHARGTATWLSQLAQLTGSAPMQPAPTGNARHAFGWRLTHCLTKSSPEPSTQTCLSAVDASKVDSEKPVPFSSLVTTALRLQELLTQSGDVCGRAAPLSGAESREVSQRLGLAALAQDFLAEELNRSDYGRATPDELKALRQALLAVTATLGQVLPCAGSRGTEALSPLKERLASLEKEAGALANLKQDRSMVVSSRFSPLASAQLLNFGAFLDEPLRMTDYYIGVYEAAHQLAENFCTEQDPYNTDVWNDAAESRQRCIGQKLEFISGKLDVARSGPASHVFETLAKRELMTELGEDGQKRVLASPEWKWLSTFPPFPKHRALLDDTITVNQVLTVLTSKETFCQAPSARGKCLADLELKELSQGLVQQGYLPRSESMRLFLADPTRWTLELATRGTSRISTLQGEARPNWEFGPALNAVRLLTTRGAGLRESLRINASSVPLGQTPSGTSKVTPWLFTLVPYRASIDIAHRGLMLSWFEPTVRPNADLTVRLGLNPLELRWKDSALPQVSSSVTPSLAYAVSTFASVGAGPTVEARWREQGREQWALGGEVYADFAQDRIRLGLGFRDTPATSWAGLVYLSFADVNGMLFWMTR